MTIAYLFYQAENNSNTTACGGRMVNRLANSAGGLPVIPPSEQVAGVNHWRKLFVKVADLANTPIIRAKAFLKSPSSSTGTRAVFGPGTQRDTLATKAARNYATGVLNAAILTGETVLIVDFETGCAADFVVQAGDTLFIGDGVNEEVNLQVSDVAWTAEQAQITLVSGIANDYLAGAFVGACLVAYDVITSADNLVKTFSTSTYDETTYPLVLENLSTIEQTVTLTFTDATSFSVISDKISGMPNGSTLTDYAPVNPDFSLPYFRIPALGWGGSGTVGETMTFQVHPAALALWLKHEVYAGAAAETDLLPLALRFEY